jgi:hypothetical protein
VGDGIRLHVQAREVAQDVGLELLLLFGRVGVVEPKEHLALVPLRVVLVQQHRLDNGSIEGVLGKKKKEKER